MKTLREIISTIRNVLKTVNLDDRIPNRMIAHLIQTYTTLFIRREADSRKIYKEAYLFQTICVDFAPYHPEAGCHPILTYQCNEWVKSVNPIPELYTNNYSSFLKGYSLDEEHTYTYKTIDGIITASKQEFGTNRFFSLENNYIIIKNPILKQLKFRGLFVKPQNLSACQSVLDTPLYIPQHLLADLERSVISDLLKMNKTLTEDELPNLNNLQKTAQQIP